MKKVLFLMIIIMVSSFIYASYYIGTKAEDSWEVDPATGDPWMPNWRGRDVCGKWYETMENYSGIVQISNTTLRSPAKSRYETDGDQNTAYGLDGFDIYLHCGHSGIKNWNGIEQARWDMYEVHTRALSSYMRLGDEARELKLFSTYGCQQMNNDDGGRTTVRWRQIFKGGLKYATGFHGSACLFGSDYAKNRQLGIDYANYLNTTNKKIKDAWWDAVKEHDSNQPAVGSSGLFLSNAQSRRDNMEMPDLLTFTTLRDNSAAYFAWHEWN